MDMVPANLSGLDMEQSLRAIMDIRAQLAFLSMDRPRITRSLRGLEDGLAMFNRLGVRINLCLTICLLAETYFMAGQYEKGEQASLAVKTSLEIGDRWCFPRIHTIRARLLQRLCEVDAAEASLRTAVDIAAAQSAKGAQLHSANSLARLWRDQGKRDEARELLAPAYGWFTEGFDTVDLREAKWLPCRSSSQWSGYCRPFSEAYRALGRACPPPMR